MPIEILWGFMSIHRGDFDKWSSMWKMRVPPKWKTFLWRAICDILPTTTNLIIKRVEVDPTCQMCGLAHEDVMHALVTCEYSRLVWNVSQLPITNIGTNSFPSWLTSALTTLTEEQSGLMVAVLYQLWRSRISAIWDGALPHPTGAWRRAAASISSFRQANQRPSHPMPVAAPVNDNHARPRCYIDAGFHQATGKATFGIVLLSPDGSFFAVRNGKLPICFSPLMAEALACMEALS
ncbi:PREDICTED: uncharacterized protein LOC109189891 [Ipomoea nil]|uniref:uncharacterized protein LOC109189891 n=1 Tax=Ipomoea nil TaxID=35883 RepID=UPI000901B43D|nr:PREDICTED: uncharacterized protein LOC109189891 [Ipomoea nil]